MNASNASSSLLLIHNPRYPFPRVKNVRWEAKAGQIVHHGRLGIQALLDASGDAKLAQTRRNSVALDFCFGGYFAYLVFSLFVGINSHRLTEELYGRTLKCLGEAIAC